MRKNLIIVALGRSAFGETFPEQRANVKEAANAVADLVEAGYEVVITHSNGPQIGMVHTAMTEFSRLDSRYTVAPMSVCGAMSQGYIGYDLQNMIRTELLDRGIYKPVSTIITQVKVNPFDKAFSNPSKPPACFIDAVFIGPAGDVLGFFLELWLGISHGDGEPFGAEHGAVIHAVAKDDDVFIRNGEAALKLFDAVLLMDRLDEHGIRTEPDVREWA